MLTWLANEKLGKAADTAAKLVQIVAFITAGWWAYRTFIKTVAPGLESRSTLNTDIRWSPYYAPETDDADEDLVVQTQSPRQFPARQRRTLQLSAVKPRVALHGPVIIDDDRRKPRECTASFSTDFKNDGVGTIDIAKVTFKAWLSSETPQTNKTPTRSSPIEIDETSIKSGKPFFLKTFFKPGETPLIGHYPLDRKTQSTLKFHFLRAPGSTVIFQSELEDSTGETITAWSSTSVCEADDVVCHGASCGTHISP